MITLPQKATGPTLLIKLAATFDTMSSRTAGQHSASRLLCITFSTIFTILLGKQDEFALKAEPKLGTSAAQSSVWL